jgi:hypothetical protein
MNFENLQVVIEKGERRNGALQLKTMCD